MKAYWGSGVTSALGGGEWSASCTGCFTPRERAPDTHWIGGWVGPRTSLDAFVKRKIHSPCQESNPGTLIIQPNTSYLEGCGFYSWSRRWLSGMKVFEVFTSLSPNKCWFGTL